MIEQHQFVWPANGDTTDRGDAACQFRTTHAQVCRRGIWSPAHARPLPCPEFDAAFKCTLCGYVRPWRMFDPYTGMLLCQICRDGADKHANNLFAEPPSPLNVSPPGVARAQDRRPGRR
jgi:hypothetical protein